MDELRDYRFYANDMLHPNDLGVTYIWEKFKRVWIAQGAWPTMEKVATMQSGLDHRSFNPESLKHQEFLKALDQKIAYLQKEFPFMKF